MLRIGVIGCGFWSRFQIPAWHEFEDCRVVAVCSRNLERVTSTANQFDIPFWTQDMSELVRREDVDVVDIIAGVEGHRAAVELAAEARKAVICQKPMAETWEDCRAMVEATRQANVWFALHENWRYQAPMMRLRKLLDDGVVGEVFRGQIRFNTSFPVFDNQPFLAETPRFILSDIGSHVLDCARFLFGEAATLACVTRRVNRAIKGEDVATVLMKTIGGKTVTVEMSYASPLEDEAFPQTYVTIEGSEGSIRLGKDYQIRVYRPQGGVQEEVASPPTYAWADPEYALVHASIVACHNDLRRAILAEVPAPTSGDDNLKTMALVHAAYESAETGQTISMKEFMRR